MADTVMSQIVDRLYAFFTAERVVAASRAAVVMAVAVTFAPLARRALRRVAADRLRPQQLMLGQRLVSYLILGLASTWCLRELGFEISVLLGAAGVVTVAVGFASQTSVSNVISGLFLIFEQPFGVADSIEASGVTGEVLSIDLLSVKLRTADNLFVRIPNETLLKSPVVNLTRYPRRAFVLPLAVAPQEDIERIREIVVAQVAANPLCLTEPRPVLQVLDYDDAALRLTATVWSERADMVNAKYGLFVAVQRAFAAAGVSLPAAQRRLVGPVGPAALPTPPGAALP